MSTGRSATEHSPEEGESGHAVQGQSDTHPVCHPGKHVRGMWLQAGSDGAW